MPFVPAEQAKRYTPCHHIPLNDAGDTIASLEFKGNLDELDRVVKTWLKTRIAELELELSATE